MIAYTRVFRVCYSKKLMQGFFESFSGWNEINGCVKDKASFSNQTMNR